MVRFPAGAGNSSLHHRVENDPIQWIPRALPLDVKRPGREADHSPPPNQECVEFYLHSPYKSSWRGA
jgi:hypothetical protein